MKQLLAAPPAVGAAWLTILTVLAAPAAYYRILSGFAEWDDEGTLMMTVKQYLTGSRLYEVVYSGYGPVYYFYNWLVRTVTGTVVDHNTVRITSAALVLVASLACAWIVLRQTQSLAAASVTHILVFRVLAFFGNEPGHPQELCLLLLIGLVASGFLTEKPRTRWAAMAAAGSLAAALTLVKINIGIFVILSVAVAVLFQAPDGWISRLAKYGAGAAALLLPLALMRIHLNDPPAQAYCFVVMASVLALLVGLASFARPGSLSSRECVAAVAGFAVTFAATLLVLAAQGVPMSRVLAMLVLTHITRNVSQGTWYLAVALGRMWIVWALAGLAAAVFFARALRGGKASGDARLAPFQVLFGGTALCIGLAAPSFLLGFVTPFCWLLLCQPENRPGRETNTRVLLATTSVLQTLYAYPVAGSQTYFLRVLLILVASISLSDGLRALSPGGTFAALVRRFAQPVAAVTLAGLALAYLLLDYRAKQLYTSLTPLNLPGAELIHVEAEEAEDYQWLVARVRQNCDTFVGLPGIPSLYFWTGKPLPGPEHTPPGPLNSDVWMVAYSPAEQQAIVDDLSRFPNACAVYHPSGVDFWNTGKLDVRGWPLANHILTHFKTIGQTGDYQLMVRNERQLEVPAGVRRQPLSQPR